MANKPLKYIKFPGLDDTYTVPQVDSTLAVQGAAADAKETGDRFTQTNDALLDLYPYDTATGAIASFSDGANVPVKDLTISIVPSQSGSGDPAPDNIRPISGWTGANVYVQGENFLKNDYTLFSELGYYMVYKTNIPDGTPLAINFFDNDTTVDVSDVSMGFISNKATGSALQGTDYVWVFQNGAVGTKYKNIAMEQEIRICGFMVYPKNSSAVQRLFQRYKIMVAYGDTKPTAYVPFVSNPVLPISWQTEAGTVYGGTLDVTTGVLTVDMARVDLGTLDWQLNSTTHRAIVVFNDINPPSVPTVLAKAIAEKYAQIPASGSLTQDGKFAVVVIGSETRLYFYYDATVPSGGLVYELATPQTYQLTPTEVKALLGNNNIFADTGDTTVTYRADIKLYIERLTAPDSEDMIADANITSGSYFMVGNSLYKATANIANGAAIIVGTNCTRKSLSEALNEINA